eukprot:8737268-Pyramimonas_sp.AAC.1
MVSACAFETSAAELKAQPGVEEKGNIFLKTASAALKDMEAGVQALGAKPDGGDVTAEFEQITRGAAVYKAKMVQESTGKLGELATKLGSVGGEMCSKL